ncbi:MAG: 5'/3'-nucleotidase SurE, partial [Phycisphaerae bacterium]|nr:5'/3'-nucleotidase SurE [Phycisphaerae bacterium]
MRILLTNDDGIHAPGIIALHDALLAGDGRVLADDLFTVAPLTVQSATGHGVTFRQPLITKQLQASPTLSGIAVDGRPADCVKLAISRLWPERFGQGSRPDLVVSGMNMGANVGINVLYSGTIAAALEAAFLGVPAIAVSLHHGTGSPRYDVAAAHARQVIDRLLAAAGPGGLGRGACVSINLPRTEAPGPLPPVRVCPMNTHGMIDAFTKNVNPLGETYYWSAGTPMDFHAT